MSKTTWLITGANRGLGLEFTRQVITSPSNVVFATCRDPSTAKDLKALTSSANLKGTLHIVQLDQNSEDSVTRAAKEVGELLGTNEGLNYLLNNAAVNLTPEDTPLTLKRESFVDTITANILGPALVTQALFPYVKRADRKVVMNMTSGLGSIGSDLGVKCTSYSISKAGLNMLTYKQKKEYPDVIFVVVDPGWNKTDMGGEGATEEPEYTVGKMLKLLDGLTLKDTGNFYGYRGNIIPW